MLPPRAYYFIGLNAVRVLSIVALLLVFSSNIVTLVNDVKAVNRFLEAGEASRIAAANNVTMTAALKSIDYMSGSTVPNQPAGPFWAVLNRLLIIAQTVILVMSEIGFPSQFFTKYFPVLGREFGLGALGVIQMLIGAAVLSHRVDTFTLVSAFFLFSVGCLNVLLGLIFRDGAKSKRSVTSWRDHAKSALPTHIGPVDVRPVVNAGAQYMGHKAPFDSPPPSFLSQLHHTGSSIHSTEKSPEKNSSGLGFGRQGEKAAAFQGYLLSKPIESLPKYAPARQ
ncbi:hypothetical protein FA15DRAFT_669065 [Coprinopsis marcescibilis]|uniref:DUF7598 domain-containing protein n=1 Tax=Coprinopsis marcescibilis TaxID=230819 RepID=A0A5C3KW26_COPMA|nr:hypothetical protein FA15DRAFT_669065 [Coprinopsis marcescibilis]